MTGLIYVAIVALWAAVLIPMWLRRHDDDQARRIERHRVAMGTLARIADDADVAQGLAARRRRIIVASTATVGALATTGWVAGLVPGVITILLWLPLLAYLPVAVLAERRSARVSAERALDERRRARRAERSDRSARDIPAHTQAEVPMTHARVSPPAWEEVFDQTA